MRVLITTEAVGGIWHYSVDLARGLARLGVETVLAVLGTEPSDSQRAMAGQVPGLRLVETKLALDRLAEDGRGLAEAAKHVAGLAYDCGADIVHLNTAVLAGLTRFPVPVVVAHHNCTATWWDSVNRTDLPQKFVWRTELVRAGLEAADMVVTPTSAFGEMVMRRYGLAEVPRTVHNGRTPPPTSLGDQHDFAFTAGRLWDQGKNLDTLDAAAGELGVPLRAAGPLCGPNGSEVMFDNIHCLGALDPDEMAQWLAARPVFVSAALYEPFGVSVLEAAAAGCPLILSDIPTFRELWDGVAIFVAARDERGFTEAISGLVGDDFERAVLGHAAKERAARFTPDAMAAQMANIYRTLLPAVRRPILAAAREAA